MPTPVSLGPLTRRQAKFVQFYRQLGNATLAARHAGYSKASARVIGAENLSKPAIRLALARTEPQVVKKIQVNADWVEQRLIELTERCMQKEPVLDDDGNPSGVWKFDSKGAAKALELLGKRFGMFQEKDIVVNIQNNYLAFLDGLRKLGDKLETMEVSYNREKVEELGQNEGIPTTPAPDSLVEE